MRQKRIATLFVIFIILSFIVIIGAMRSQINRGSSETHQEEHYDEWTDGF